MSHLHEVECRSREVPLQMEPESYCMYPAEFEAGSEPAVDANRI